MAWKILLFILLTATTACAQNIEWQPVGTKTNASFRGICVVDDSVAWVSGGKGWVGVTVNGGKNWPFRQVRGYEQCDFRSIYAFDAKNAIIANAGAPAYILRTTDGGATWEKVYENEDTAAFIDGVIFRDALHGIVYGDPIDHHMLLLHTQDGGKTWKEAPLSQRPLLKEGEASFAASGTCIRHMGGKRVAIATGGKVSRLWVSKNWGKKWKVINTPILQGAAGTGIFSFLPMNKKYWVIAGGDYTRDTLRTANLFYTGNKGKTWNAPNFSTRGYRECLETMGGNTLLAAGPGGIDISYDAGMNWLPQSDERQYHVVRRSKQGNLVVIAGGGGKLAILKLKDDNR